MGAPPEVVEAARANKEETVFEVYADNWDAVRIFVKLSTQWKIALGMGAAVYLGLDYTAVDLLFKIEGVADVKAVFYDIQIMERAALSELNKQGAAK